MNIIYLAIGAGVFALAYAVLLTMRIIKSDPGSEQVQAIGEAIQEGAMAFLSREYRLLAIFVVVMFIVLAVFIDFDVLDKVPGDSPSVPETAISYLVGAIGSALAGFIGMSIAVRANTRTTVQAQRGLNSALRIAFNSGSVMGVSVVGIGLIGITVVYWVFQDISVVAGFGFGASSIALFARVGGGIYTKAADVGADLVGKIEQGIPEDDPRNPATVADNVGDNVGDVAGMGADLFESYVGSIIATIALAAVGASALEMAAPTEFDENLVMLPILVALIGIFASVLGTFLVRTSEGANMGRLLWSLRTGIFGAGILVLIGTAISVSVLDLDFKLFWIVVIGLVAGQIIGTSSEVFTSYEYRFTKNLAQQSETGPATVIIGGLGLGMLSTVVPALVIVVAMWFANDLAGTYGVALTAVGMLSTLGITLATDAYGPVADNAGGIAEQAGLDPEVRERTDALDSLGNTTAATGKGFAIGSAVLTALALMAAYSTATEAITGTKPEFDLSNVEVLMGLFIGSLTPFLFGALTMQAVGRAAMAMVTEVRRQFREIPGLIEGTADADYARAVDISTNGAMKEMVLPGILAVAAPILVGVILGAEALGGLLIGSIASGFLLAVMMANAGGAWDNAKKFIEAGAHGGKGSASHEAAVVGDTVGDPFKDTSGPALNILIKLMSIVALVFAPLFL
ncbi:MAG: sodium-translocating pyrophosphatase [SAR202 cluster bacterium]|nr:sodium-translocating pyrophosphatase [SAR202 cluster bacterium]MDP6302657.1 sodium-translocating pyrophosphatase [SAR202 cluster bacterium]MDP7103356.1 sodium-translocating pyrophosphatase [SAR202 cluster bacterium]MDP7223780.1 sodium-translocating pyrophosphatase [SAR202 cluster bacterium]MDP7415053.1 sodium-translocating pyrophosphatase [SAR202 cluster bacterium]